jgi:predicted nucleic acid-binding Zn ribbon protein
MIQFFPKAEQTRVGTAKAQLREEIKDVGVGAILRGVSFFVTNSRRRWTQGSKTASSFTMSSCPKLKPCALRKR